MTAAPPDRRSATRLRPESDTRPLVAGVAGGSASGKSAVVDEVVRRIGPEGVTVLPHDAYYRDLSHLPLADRRRVNVDHPDSLETDLLLAHLRALRSGDPVEIPVYDFATHVRLAERRRLEPAPVLVVEGILVLAEARLRQLMDLKIYVHVPEEERLARRLVRDVEQRGRTAELVREEHDRRVQPMHEEFVRPSRAHADIVVHEGGRNHAAIEEVVARMTAMLGRES